LRSIAWPRVRMILFWMGATASVGNELPTYDQLEGNKVKKLLLLTGMMLAVAAPAHAADSLPDAMMGSWSLGDEEGIMERVGPDSGDFYVAKDKCTGVDDECTILHVEKLAENLYTVQASCAYPDGGGPATIDTSEFELLGKDKLRVSPVGS